MVCTSRAHAGSRLQVLIYQAFDWQIPSFAHVSLILAPDKSKLSKRHGATSVGEFREQGCLAPAMVNFLSLLGWNDGSEQEIFSTDELQEKFSLDRITKSAAVFDNTKLVQPPSRLAPVHPWTWVQGLAVGRVEQPGSRICTLFEHLKRERCQE